MKPGTRKRKSKGPGGARPGAGRKGLFSAGTEWIRLPLPSPIVARLRKAGGPREIREELLAALREARPGWGWE